MSNKTLVRFADCCPMCRAYNSIRIDRSFQSAAGDCRIAYGFCRECSTRITIREIKKVSTT